MFLKLRYVEWQAYHILQMRDLIMNKRWLEVIKLFRCFIHTFQTKLEMVRLETMNIREGVSTEIKKQNSEGTSLSSEVGVRTASDLTRIWRADFGHGPKFPCVFQGEWESGIGSIFFLFQRPKCFEWECMNKILKKNWVDIYMSWGVYGGVDIQTF